MSGSQPTIQLYCSDPHCLARKRKTPFKNLEVAREHVLWNHCQRYDCLFTRRCCECEALFTSHHMAERHKRLTAHQYEAIPDHAYCGRCARASKAVEYYMTMLLPVDEAPRQVEAERQSGAATPQTPGNVYTPSGARTPATPGNQQDQQQAPTSFLTFSYGEQSKTATERQAPLPEQEYPLQQSTVQPAAFGGWASGSGPNAVPGLGQVIGAVWGQPTAEAPSVHPYAQPVQPQPAQAAFGGLTNGSVAAPVQGQQKPIVQSAQGTFGGMANGSGPVAAPDQGHDQKIIGANFWGETGAEVPSAAPVQGQQHPYAQPVQPPHVPSSGPVDFQPAEPLPAEQQELEDQQLQEDVRGRSRRRTRQPAEQRGRSPGDMFVPRNLPRACVSRSPCYTSRTRSPGPRHDDERLQAASDRINERMANQQRGTIEHYNPVWNPTKKDEGAPQMQEKKRARERRSRTPAGGRSPGGRSPAATRRRY